MGPKNDRLRERLSKKLKNGDLCNLACNEINNLQASNSQIQGFSTVSDEISNGQFKRRGRTVLDFHDFAFTTEKQKELLDPYG